MPIDSGARPRRLLVASLPLLIAQIEQFLNEHLHRTATEIGELEVRD